MRPQDRGVSKKSEIYFHIPSEFAQKALYWTPYVGYFECTEKYRIEREFLDSFLLILVDEGEMFVKYHGETKIAGPNDVILLDCKEPHSYGAIKNLKFRFFHFLGLGSQPYFDSITSENVYVLHPSKQFAVDRAFDIIYQLAQENFLAEDLISIQVHSILSVLLSSSKYSFFGVNDSIVQRSITYIESNFMTDLSVKDIANQVNLSMFYFSRIFKKYTNKSPHEYLLNLRLNYSQQLLISSNRSMEDIASECGFKSTSHFIRAFKNVFGVTPNKFRQSSIV